MLSSRLYWREGWQAQAHHQHKEYQRDASFVSGHPQDVGERCTTGATRGTKVSDQDRFSRQSRTETREALGTLLHTLLRHRPPGAFRPDISVSLKVRLQLLQKEESAATLFV